MPSNQIWFGLAQTPLDPAFLKATQSAVMQRLFQFGHILTIWDNDQKIGYVWEHASFRACSNGPWKSDRPAYHFWLCVLPAHASRKESAIQAYLDLHPKGLFHLHTPFEHQDADVYQNQFGFKKMDAATDHLIFRRDTR